MANTEILARFDIDDSAIITKIAKNKKEIQELRDLNKSYIDAYQKGLKESQKAIKEQETAQDKLNQELKDGAITQEQYNVSINQSNNIIKQNKDNINKVTSEYDLNAKAIAINLERVKNLSTENNGLSKTYQSVINSQNGLLENYTNEGKSIQQLKEDNLKLINARNQIVLVTGEESEEIIKLNKLIDANTEIIRENVSVDEQRIMNIGNYKDAFNDAFDSIKGGDFEGGLTKIREIANGIGASLQNMTKQALTFIATPIGATITAIAGIGLIAKEVFDFNKSIEESNKRLRAFGLSGKELSNVRSEVQATADTFGKSFEEIATNVNSLAKSFGISFSEANKLIQEGLAGGGETNPEFLDSLQEYDQLFKQAGFSAKEFIDVLNEGADLGIYKDKLPDAIKEAGLSLNEQTKATRDALVNAFGASFTDDILAKVKNGELTVKQALQSISEQAEKSNLNQQQLAQLTADVFKGAGEDAGGSLVILQAISNSAKRELSEVAKSQIELSNATSELNKQQAELLEIEDFGTIFNTIKIEGLKFVTEILKGLNDIKKVSQPLLDLFGKAFVIVFDIVFDNFKTKVTTTFKIVGGAFALLGNAFSSFINIFKALTNGDLQGVLNAFKQGFINSFNIIGINFGSLTNKIINGLKSVVDNTSPILSALGVDVDNLGKKLEGLKSKNIEVKKTSVENKTQSTTTTQVGASGGGASGGGASGGGASGGGSNIENERQKRIENLLKDLDLEKQLFDESNKINENSLSFKQSLYSKELNILKEKLKNKVISEKEYNLEKLKLDNQLGEETAKISLERANAELNLFLANNKSKLDGAEFLTEQLIQEEEKRLNEIEKKNLDILANEKNINLEKLNQKLLNNEELTNAEIEFQTQRINLANETDLIIQQNKKALEDQIKQEKASQLEIQNQIDIKNAETKLQADLLANQQKYDAELLQLEASLKAKKLTQDQYNALEQQATAKKLELDRLARLNDISNRLKEFQQIVNGLEGVFGKNKAFATATAIINGGLAVTEILKNPSTLPDPFSYISKGIQIAGVIATTKKSIGEINSAKFERGGIAIGNSHANGGIPALIDGKTPVEIEGGEAIINKNSTSKYRGLLSAINSDGGGVAFARGGIANQTIKNITSNNFNTDLMVNEISKAVEMGSRLGTESGSQKGISDLSINNLISQNANY